MAAFTFSEDEADALTLRKALFRMILSRAAEQLTDPADLAELQESEAMEGLAFDLMEDAQRSRILTAVLAAAKRLRETIAAGEPVEEEVLPGVEDKLDEVIGFFSDHTPAAP